jgi:vacuolar-type H+-ATPase subunit B/Vma2
MDNFIVSARKYRPATFNSVVGQKALTTTLKNAIKSNHLAHAYLFCGPRGDITHAVPDNTGYITEGQFYLKGGRIEPFGSLSRLKQQVNKDLAK